MKWNNTPRPPSAFKVAMVLLTIIAFILLSIFFSSCSRHPYLTATLASKGRYSNGFGAQGCFVTLVDSSGRAYYVTDKALCKRGNLGDTVKVHY